MSQTEIIFKRDIPFVWVDISNPNEKLLKELAQRFNIPYRSLKACLDPEHLPKYEKLGETLFLITRAFDEACLKDSDNVQELTRKVALFVHPNFFLSVHRKDQPYISNLRKKWTERAQTVSDSNLSALILFDFSQAVIQSYESPIDEALVTLENLEANIFKGQKGTEVVEEGYYLKRRAFLTKRILRLSIDALTKTASSVDLSNSHLLSLKEQADGILFYADELEENVHTLLGLHVSLASYRTNEVMRILTLFSVFFLPLNFIAGIYGMNFEHMPELKWIGGYPAVLVGMFLVCVTIFLWFRARGWLK